MDVDSVLVTGANRGIGLEMVKQFLGQTNKPKYLFAACRSPDDAKVGTAGLLLCIVCLLTLVSCAY